MPIQKSARLWDPSRRVPSSHRASPVRTYVYEQLGISKPGFWADWRKRTIAEPETEEYTPDEENEINDPSQEYHLAKWPEQKKTAKKDFAGMNMDMGTAAGGGGGKGKGIAWAPLLANQSQQWFKQNPLVGSSSMDLMGLEKAIANREASTMLFGMGEKGKGASGLLALAQYYVAKTQERADARASRPFGAGEPTNFDKMLAMVAKPKPIYTPPTFEVLKKGTSVIVSKVPNQTIGQLNVSQNGYVSNPMPPQKKAADMLSKAASASTMRGAAAKATTFQPYKPSSLGAASKITL